MNREEFHKVYVEHTNQLCREVLKNKNLSDKEIVREIFRITNPQVEQMCYEICYSKTKGKEKECHSHY